MATYSENNNLEALRASKTRVTLFTINGFQLKGTIVDFDANTVVLRCDGTEQMLYKHAISTIKPAV